MRTSGGTRAELKAVTEALLKAAGDVVRGAAPSASTKDPSDNSDLDALFAGRP
jgi:hypothetical protein